MSGFKKPAGPVSGLMAELTAAIQSTPQPKINGDAVIATDPKLTKLHPFNRRSAASLSGSSIQELADSIKASGQVTPARGYRIPAPSGEPSVVLIYGARRRAARIAAGVQLHVEIVDEPSDATIITTMYAENKGRRDYFPLESGLEYKAYIDSGRYPNPTSLAVALGEDETRIRRCLDIAALPESITSLFKDPALLTLKSGTKIAVALKDATQRARILAAADQLSGTNIEGDPTPIILSAIAAPQAPKPINVEIKRNGRAVGTIRGGEQAKDSLLVNLTPKAPPELKADILAVLRKHSLI